MGASSTNHRNIPLQGKFDQPSDLSNMSSDLRSADLTSGGRKQVCEQTPLKFGFTCFRICA